MVNGFVGFAVESSHAPAQPWPPLETVRHPAQEEDEALVALEDDVVAVRRIAVAVEVVPVPVMGRRCVGMSGASAAGRDTSGIARTVRWFRSAEREVDVAVPATDVIVRRCPGTVAVVAVLEDDPARRDSSPYLFLKSARAVLERVDLGRRPARCWPR